MSDDNRDWLGLSPEQWLLGWWAYDLYFGNDPKKREKQPPRGPQASELGTAPPERDTGKEMQGPHGGGGKPAQ